MAAKLVLTFNDSVISEHPLSNDETTIGRRFANDIHIDNLGVSGSHAKVLLIGGNAFIEDLNSTNGTYVNGSRVEKKPLSNGDIISVGKYQLKFENDTPAVNDDFEKTVILQANAVSIDEPPVKAAPAATTKNAKLVVANGPNKGKGMSLTKAVTRLGKPGNQAAAIAKRPQGYFFVNVGGEGAATPILNGGKVPIGAVKLNNGDKITIGNIELVFQL